MNFFRLFLLIPALLIFLIAASVQADFGNWFIANKRLANKLDSSTAKISYRFTCQEDLTLTAASIYCVEAVHPPAYRISFEEDEQGRPSGNSLASSSYIPAALTWTTLPLDNVSLVKGKVYHLVVEQDQLRGGGHPVGVIGPSNYASFLTTDVLNHLNPQDGAVDAKTNTLYYDKGQWRELNQEPVYAIYGLGSHFQGNPYDDPGMRPIYGSGDPKDKTHQVLQGQALHFHCPFTAKSLTFRLKRQGNPTSPLTYSILQFDYHAHRADKLYSGVIVNAEKTSSAFQWITVDLPPQYSFFPECWFFALQTDSGKSSEESPGCQDCYILSDVGNSGGLPRADSLTFDGGPHLSREIYSTDSGSPNSWKDVFERDANVGALGPACPAHNMQTFPPFPTPVPFENELRFNP